MTQIVQFVCDFVSFWGLSYYSINQINYNIMKALDLIMDILMVIALIAIIVAGVCFFINTMMAIYCFLVALGFSFLFAILSVFED